MSIRVRVSSRHRIAVPAAERRRLHIRGGDHLLVEIRGDHIVLIPEPRDYAAHLRGVHGEVWNGVEPGQHVAGERDAWRR